jgi:hypothetical protein
MNGTMNEVSFAGPPVRDAILAGQSLSAANLLQTWEIGERQFQVEKALTLLAVAHPDATRESLATLSIGQRDAALISLREKLFGSQFSSLTDCPACGERLELNFNAMDIRASPAPADMPLLVSQADYELQLRLPNSFDLLQLSGCANTAEMRTQLFEQCVVSIAHKGQPGSAERLEDMPAEIVDLAIERMGQADPQADVEVDLRCPDCRYAWQTGFDIVSYLWSELRAWAMQLLREVHLLASNYGWAESDILSMSNQRRRCYLELLIG